jgi:hypothetical protein
MRCKKFNTFFIPKNLILIQESEVCIPRLKIHFHCICDRYRILPSSRPPISCSVFCHTIVTHYSAILRHSTYPALLLYRILPSSCTVLHNNPYGTFSTKLPNSIPRYQTAPQAAKSFLFILP